MFSDPKRDLDPKIAKKKRNFLALKSRMCFAACWNRPGCFWRPAQVDCLERAGEEGARRKAVRRSSRGDHEGDQPAAEDAEQQRPGDAHTKVSEDFQLNKILCTSRNKTTVVGVKTVSSFVSSFVILTFWKAAAVSALCKNVSHSSICKCWPHVELSKQMGCRILLGWLLTSSSCSCC